METTETILAGLLHPTPSGAMKLRAAWDGLHPETRMHVLQRLSADDAPPRPARLYRDLYQRALHDDSAYVRYLAVRQLDIGADANEKRELEKDIEADPSPLVRYALLEGHYQEPARFFALPQEARLAVARGLDNRADRMAAIIQHAIDRQFDDTTASPIELRDILLDYLNKKSFQEWYRPKYTAAGWYGGYEYDCNQQLIALWKLLPHLPAPTAWPLAEYLPPPPSDEIPLDTPTLLTAPRYALASLLFRAEIQLTEFRHYVFNHRKELADDYLLAAAIAQNFSLAFSEFHA